jgi:transcriptional regulator with XRE-family HTH domain
MRDAFAERVLNDFVFADSRLGSHPVLGATCLWLRGAELVSGELAPPRPTGRELRIPLLPETIATAPLRDGCALIIQEPHLVPNLPKEAERWGLVGDILSVLVEPLFDANQVVGTLSFHSRVAHFFDDRRLAMTRLIGALIVYLHLHWNDRISTPASRALGEAMRQVRESQGLTQDQLGSRLGLNRITLSRNESGAQPPSREGLYRWCSALGLLSATTAARVEVVDITSTILPILHDDPRKLALLSPEQFERFVAERLDRMGYDTTLSGPTTLKDGGIDLIAVPRVRTVGCFLLAGQVKHHRAGARTGRAAVDRLLAWEASAFRLGLLVTNTEFTKDALWVAGLEQHRSFLRLRDFNDLKRWIQDDFSSDRDWREIPETIDVAPGIAIQVPRPGLAHPELVWPAAPRVITRE